MSTFNNFLELSEQLCYVQCSYCTTILLVSVPCSCLLKTVTVRCGHCDGLLSVNMVKASFIPLHLLASIDDDQQMQELPVDTPPLMPPIDDDDDDDVEDKVPVTTVVNKPPEKRQRAPSAYNHFIKEEIQRLKAREPNMTHKEAFSTAAKNWAHFPCVQYKGDGESCSQGLGKVTKHGDIEEIDIQSNGFRGRKASRHYSLE